MSEMITVNVMGVPEHFNLPWYLAIEAGKFSREGIDVCWQDAPGGTGAMMRALESGQTDLIVALTEGVVAGIAQGADVRIVQQYVNSSLRWGIHVSAKSAYQQIEELADSRFAVSRPASGSHLMAFVLGQQRGWNTSAMQFVEVGGIDGARQALAEGSADTFLWEQLMTKPVVDSGEFRRLDAIDTPWPCFVIAARRPFLEQNAEPMGRLLQIIQQVAPAFGHRQDAVTRITQRFDLAAADVANWLSCIEWSSDARISKDMLHQVIDTLVQIGAIDQKVSADSLCDQQFVELE